MKINVGVMYGGNSTEHEISVISALQAINNIDKEKFNVIPIYISKDGTFHTSEALKNIKCYKYMDNIKNISYSVILTKKNNEFVLMRDKFPYTIESKIDIVLPVFHGYNTEDGCIAGFLEMLNIPYAQSDIYASVIAQDKIFQKAILKENNIPVLDYIYFYESDYEIDPGHILKEVEKLGYPVIVKPSRQGSSVGIKIAKSKKDLSSCIEEALNYDEKILIEKALMDMKELNASVLGDNKEYKVSKIEEVYGADEILSFKDKYLSNGSKTGGSKGMASAGRKIPADISVEERKDIEKYSIMASKALNTCGVVRIDYMLDKQTGKIYLNELNITPGSMAFYLWTPDGLEYKDMLTQVINLGIKRYKQKNKKTSSFKSNVLENFNGAKGVKK